MNDFIPFKYQGNAIRIANIEGKSFFAAEDAAKLLGYPDAERAISKHCVGNTKHCILPTTDGLQETRIISESDLLLLVASSKLSTPQGVLTLVEALNKTTNQLTAAQSHIEKLSPKAESFEDFLSSNGDYSINAASKLLQRRGFETGQNRLASLLLTWGWIYRGEKRSLRAKQTQISRGHIDEKTFYYTDQETGQKTAGRVQVRITPKGIDAIAERLKTPQQRTAENRFAQNNPAKS